MAQFVFPFLQPMQFWMDFQLFVVNHKHGRVCRMDRCLNFTCIFKVMRPGICNKTAKILDILSCP